MANDETGFWAEEADAPTRPEADVTDLAFALSGRAIPVDHAEALADAIAAALPWFADEPLAGLHLIHTAASGNGWYSPADGSNGLVYIARRTRLVLRLPHARVEAAGALSGTSIDLAGNPVTVGAAKAMRLRPDDTLYSRHVLADAALTEPQFLEWARVRLQGIGIASRRLVGGRGHTFHIGGEVVATRTLMVADLAPDDSFRLQTLGIGEGRHRGFGLFIPHKAVTKAL